MDAFDSWKALKLLKRGKYRYFWFLKSIDTGKVPIIEKYWYYLKSIVMFDAWRILVLLRSTDPWKYDYLKRINAWKVLIHDNILYFLYLKTINSCKVLIIPKKY